LTGRVSKHDDPLFVQEIVMAELTKKQLEWKVHVDAALASGMPLAEYARSHKIEVKKLYSYSSAIQRRLIPAPKPAFVRVQRPVPTSVGVRIELANGVRLNIAAPADLGLLFQQLAKLP
jgi:hypothetical protein